MSKRIIRRRQFLRGSGGLVLGIPFLPSLVPGPAYGQDPSFSPPRRFVSFATNHGGIRRANMYPEDGVLTERTELYDGHQISRGDLLRTTSGDRASISPVLSAAGDLLTAQLISKMNVLSGLDIPFYISHNTGGVLGNYARNDGNGDEGRAVHGRSMPTVDQLMAWSPNFYTDLTGNTKRSISVGRSNHSYGFSSPLSASGSIVESDVYSWGHHVYRELFPGGIPTREEPEEPVEPVRRRSIVDRVHQSFASLSQSNRRLSAADRQRLRDHMEQLRELERRVEAGAGGGAIDRITDACVNRDAPAQLEIWGDTATRAYTDSVDVVALAFACGVTQIATFHVIERFFTSYSGDWHQEIAHQWHTSGPQERLVQVNQAVFEQMILRLVSQMDGISDGPDQTMLDNSLVMWGQECGEETHNSSSIPVVTFGRAGGYLRTGQYCDYRNRARRDGYTGLLYSQWLATVLQSMGLPPSEWQGVPNNGAAGYAVDQISPSYAEHYSTGVVENASEPLPFLRS